MFTNPSLWLLLIFLPIAFMIFMHWRFASKISGPELAISIAIFAVLSSVSWYFMNTAAIFDTQVLNGVVTGKDREIVHCRHSYSCHCRRDSKGNQSCDTCYEHPYDVDYTVNTSVGNIDIPSIDPQGLFPSPYWEAAKSGEPAAVEKTYLNYLKASPDSIFYHDPKSVKVPGYPRVYDYYKYNRVINVGTTADTSKLNDDLNETLKSLGASKQVNIIVVLTNQSPATADDLRVGWLGGKKNDVIVVLGLDGQTIAWQKIFSWAENDIFNVELRDGLANLKTYNADSIAQIVAAQIQKNFVRKSMKDYAYLMDDYHPAMWMIILYVILLWSVAGGLMYFMYKEEVA